MCAQTLREKCELAFATPLTAGGLVLRRLQDSDVCAVRVFYTADDGAYMMDIGWDEKYRLPDDYIRDTLIRDMYDDTHFVVGAFTPDAQSMQAQFTFSTVRDWGTYLGFYAVGAVNTMDMTEHLYFTIRDRAIAAGILNDPGTRQRERLRDAFSRAVGPHGMVTDRLVLRPVHADDEGRMQTFLLTDDGAAARHLQLKSHRLKSQLDRRSTAQDLLNNTLTTNTLTLGIFNRGAEQELIGYLDIYCDLQNRPRLGYFTLPSQRRNGYAFEAYKAALAWLDNTLPAPVSVAEVEPGNTASIHFLEKAGFMNSGLHETSTQGFVGQKLVLMKRAL